MTLIAVSGAPIEKLLADPAKRTGRKIELGVELRERFQ